jgi:adenine phosphoribosyltransferase
MKNFIKLCVLSAVCLYGGIIYARELNVIVASGSAHKIAAVREAFNAQFPADTIHLIPCKTSSGIPEQPLGRKVALKGARNRLNGIDSALVAQADYLISIENYIEQSPATSRWYDVGLVVFHDCAHSQEMVLYTRSTFIPDQFIVLAHRMSGLDISDEGYGVTIGTAIQKSFGDRAIDPHDWHRETEFGGVSRQELLQEALFKALHAQEIEFLKNQIIFYPDFPKPGILFADFWPILNNAHAFQICLELLAERYKNKNISAIVGLESRGFILGAALAYRLGIRFVPVRKPGKLPGAIHAVSYQKEYGSDTLTIPQNVILPQERVIIIDDLIATGGSARAAIELVNRAGGHPVEFVTLLKVAALEEQARLSIPAFNLID